MTSRSPSTGKYLTHRPVVVPQQEYTSPTDQSQSLNHLKQRARQRASRGEATRTPSCSVWRRRRARPRAEGAHATSARSSGCTNASSDPATSAIETWVTQ
eukprot:5416883-Pyramimonas_sp.AAC.1